MHMPIIRLSNGLKVGNFSSPHAFLFTTGETLPACSPERAKLGMLNAVEIITTRVVRGVELQDIALEFHLNQEVINLLEEAEVSEADIVIVPLPVVTACRLAGRPLGKARTIRSTDRVTKAIFPDRFCL